jgi:CHAD domain-containing protein/HD superfamily phosphodiesterase
MNSDSKVTGLRYWMLRVLEECENVSAHFTADPVHDLRVSLRRCRSMADGMTAMDPDCNWKAMKKAGKQLFQRLGALRDVQIMMDWIEKLDLAKLSASSSNENAVVTPEANNSPTAGVAPEALPNPAQLLLRILETREADEKRQARAALESFDKKQWHQWSNTLPRRAARIRRGSAVFKHLALERWTAARELHAVAFRNRSQVALHTLRIGIKRFRYIVENFLPAEHAAWANDLKHMQDLLGEVHDLDVLWSTAQSCHIFPDELSRNAWHERIIKERMKRIAEYKQRTTGPTSMWNVWRAGLPQGKEVQEIATRRMKLWAKALDPDFAHSERVARLSLQLYDGLVAASAFEKTAENGHGSGDRCSLYAAAVLHDVGKSEGKKGHHKESQELIQKHGTPMGWNEEDIRQAALVARFHCGALPGRNHKAMRDLPPEQQKSVIRLSAILRLANALDCSHDGHIRRLKVEQNRVPLKDRRKNGFLRKPLAARNEALVIAAEGYAEGTPTAQTVAAERYLLETVLRRPVMVRPLRAGTLR